VKTYGWLLDVYISGDRTVLWIKTDYGEVVRLWDRYLPDFYVKPRDGCDVEELASIIRQHPNVVDAEPVEKYPTVSAEEKTRVVHVVVDEVGSFRRVVRDVESLGLVDRWFNVDILHIQRYLFSKQAAPTEQVEVEYSEDGMLRSLKPVDEGFKVEPPPFTPLILQVETGPDGNSVSRVWILNDRLKPVMTLKGGEREVLEGLAQMIREGDPDVLVAPSPDSTFTRLLERARRLGVELQLGREDHRANPYRGGLYAAGRPVIPLNCFQEYGLAGLSERCRFARLPLGLASRWPAGRIIDSRQCYEAVRKGILIPRLRSYPSEGLTARQLILRDRGGLVMSPVLGLHENVAELDFESMYPNLIVRYNISYENTGPKGVKEGSRPGFLPELTRRFLERRLYFKRLRRSLPEDSLEYLWCDQRQKALKMILVCIYGFSGCDVNRYGNVYTFLEINNRAREVLARTINIALREGFQVVYADSDSIFVKKSGASREDYERLARLITEETGLRMTLDHHYRFIVFLPLKTRPSMQAVKRYYGILTSGELHYRGIAPRRRDCPPFIKEFCKQLMRILFDAETVEDVLKTQYKKARKYVSETLKKIARGQVPLEKLVVRKALRKPIEGYLSKQPHIVAAIQMAWKGRRPKQGTLIDFIYVNSRHVNPMRRVLPAELIDKAHRYYDREKYKEMLLATADATLGWKGSLREVADFLTE